jgi:hypothetical protein
MAILAEDGAAFLRMAAIPGTAAVVVALVPTMVAIRYMAAVVAAAVVHRTRQEAHLYLVGLAGLALIRVPLAQEPRLVAEAVAPAPEPLVRVLAANCVFGGLHNEGTRY